MVAPFSPGKPHYALCVHMHTITFKDGVFKIKVGYKTLGNCAFADKQVFARVNEASKGNCKFAFICCSATLICLHPFATVACTQCVKTQLSTSTSRVAMPQPPLEFDAIFFFKCKLTSSFPPRKWRIDLPNMKEDIRRNFIALKRGRRN